MKSENDRKKLEKALMDKALGFTTQEVVEEYGFSGDDFILQKRKTSTKSYPPDLSALQMLLEREGDNELYNMTDEELELLCSLFARQKEIEQVILYGSRAKGTHKPFSDVDITLLGIGLSRSHLNRLMADMDESSLPYFFDVSILSKITNPDLREQIEKTGVVLYRREDNSLVAEPDVC